MPAPQAVLNLLSCKCSRACKLPSCTCMVNQLKCTEVCKLRTCDNQVGPDDGDDDSISDFDLSSDDETDEYEY